MIRLENFHNALMSITAGYGEAISQLMQKNKELETAFENERRKTEALESALAMCAKENPK